MPKKCPPPQGPVTPSFYPQLVRSQYPNVRFWRRVEFDSWRAARKGVGVIGSESTEDDDVERDLADDDLRYFTGARLQNKHYREVLQ